MNLLFSLINHNSVADVAVIVQKGGGNNETDFFETFPRCQHEMTDEL